MLLLPCSPGGRDGLSRRQTGRPAATGVVGTIVFPALSVFLPTQCRWARAFVVPGLLLAWVLAAVIVLLVLGPGRGRGRRASQRRPVPG